MCSTYLQVAPPASHPTSHVAFSPSNSQRQEKECVAAALPIELESPSSGHWRCCITMALCSTVCCPSPRQADDNAENNVHWKRTVPSLLVLYKCHRQPGLSLGRLGAFLVKTQNQCHRTLEPMSGHAHGNTGIISKPSWP